MHFQATDFTINLSLDDITAHPDVQARAELNEEVIEEYAVSMRLGEKFPAVVVFFDGDAYWLSDGFHRYEAAKRAPVQLLDAQMRLGGKREAMLYSAGANATHGLRRTNADKRKAVVMLLKDEEWGQWNDAEIARRANVSPMTVGRLRAELISNNVIDRHARRKVQRGDTVYTQDTANIGRPPRRPTRIHLTSPLTRKGLG